MNLICLKAGARVNTAPFFAATALATAIFAPLALAQSPTNDSKPPAETYQTFYLTNLTQQNDAMELVNDLRNVLPCAKVYYVASQSAVSIKGTPEDIQLAQKVVADIDRSRKIYRLTYTITETDGGKPVRTEHFALVVVSGSKTTFKEGSRVPVVTGSNDNETSKQDSQVQYLDVGLSIEASIDGSGDGLRLHTKIEQSSLSDEKSSIGAQDPIVRQTVLDGVSAVRQGKPLVLGSVDNPGTTHHQEITVVSEPLI